MGKNCSIDQSTNTRLATKLFCNARTHALVNFFFSFFGCCVPSEMMMQTRTRTVTHATLFGGGKRKAPAKKVQKRRTPSKNESKVLDLDIGGFFNPDKYKDGAKAGGSDLAPAQKSVGYRFTGASGSAPDVDSQGKKARLGGVVYQFANKYGGNIDEYSPIWQPDTRAPGGDVYEPGTAGLAIWFAGFVGLLLTGGFAIYTTSALAN